MFCSVGLSFRIKRLALAKVMFDSQSSLPILTYYLYMWHFLTCMERVWKTYKKTNEDHIPSSQEYTEKSKGLAKVPRHRQFPSFLYPKNPKA